MFIEIIINSYFPKFIKNYKDSKIKLIRNIDFYLNNDSNLNNRNLHSIIVNIGIYIKIHRLNEESNILIEEGKKNKIINNLVLIF